MTTEAFFIHGEPDLGPLEQAYREQTLKADINQIIRIGWILITGTTLYALNDFSPAVPPFTLAVLNLTRVFTIAVSLASMSLLKRTTSYRKADWVVLLWSVTIVCLNFIFHVIYLDAFLFSILGDLVIIIALYSFFPNRFLFRVIPAVLISASDLVLLWLVRDQASLNTLRFIGVTLALGNFTGLTISVYLYTYRRNQFAAQHREQLALQATERLATLDGLTEVFNRRRFMELATGEFQRYRRYQRPFSVLMMDLDHFKRVNDSRGHAAGDAVLKAFATLSGSLIRQSDALGRLGGEEFAILLMETPAAQALLLAERVCERCEQMVVPFGSDQLRVTVSIGVAEVREGDASIEDTLKRADQALYFVKERHRNGAYMSSQ